MTEGRMMVKTMINGMKVLSYKLKEYSERIETVHNTAALQTVQAAQQNAAANGQPAPQVIAQLTVKCVEYNNTLSFAPITIH